MTDLYAALDVDREADPATIRKAYRRAAKKSHPDTGGSRESFAIVQLAHDCLTDAERRARYDQTGDPGQTQIDQTEAAALQVVTQAISGVVDSIVKQGQNPACHDLVAHAKSSLQTELGNINTRLQEAKKASEQARSLALRFKAKKNKADRIGPLFRSRAVDAERAAEKTAEQAKTFARAIEIVGDHTFAQDAAPARQVIMGYVNGVPIYATVQL